MGIKDKIIVALDVETCDNALSLVESLNGYANFFKIGLGLIGKGGLELASEIKNRGHRVFLDLKLFDISNTIGGRTICPMPSIDAMGISKMTV